MFIMGIVMAGRCSKNRRGRYGRRKGGRSGLRYMSKWSETSIVLFIFSISLLFISSLLSSLLSPSPPWCPLSLVHDPVLQRPAFPNHPDPDPISPVLVPYHGSSTASFHRHVVRMWK
jgi:hypothetical protein